MTLEHAGGSTADAEVNLDVGQPQLHMGAVGGGHVTSARDGGRGVWVRPPASLLRWSPTRRPPRHPVRTVPKRHKIGEHLDGLKDPALWTLLDIRAAPGGGGVRTGMTYDKEYGTSAGYFDKPKRVQFMEGPNEPAVAMHLQLNPRYINFEFQPLDLTFRRADDKIIHKYPDVGIELFDNTVVFGEIKSDDAWFEAPGIRRPLDRIDVALATEGLPPLLRIRGLPFRERFVAEAHRAAMDAAQTGFDEADKVAVRTVVNAARGQAKYGDVVGALGGPRAVAIDKLYAMLNSRVVGFERLPSIKRIRARYDASDVDDLHVKLRSCVSHGNAAVQIDVPTYAVGQLVASGRLLPEHHPGVVKLRGAQIETISLTDLENALRKKTQQAASQAERIPIRTAMRQFPGEKPWAQVVEGMLLGTIPFEFDGGVLSIREALIDPAKIAPLKISTSTGSADVQGVTHIALRDAFEMLVTKAEEAMAVITAARIPVVRYGAGKGIAREALSRLVGEVAFTGEAAAYTGGSAILLAHEFMRLRIPKIHGAWSRVALVKIGMVAAADASYVTITATGQVVREIGVDLKASRV